MTIRSTCAQSVLNDEQVPAPDALIVDDACAAPAHRLSVHAVRVPFNAMGGRMDACWALVRIIPTPASMLRTGTPMMPDTLLLVLEDAHAAASAAAA